jgi:hypothetical protein
MNSWVGNIRSAMVVSSAVRRLVGTRTGYSAQDVVEFLIPVTIVATCIENIVLRERAARGDAARHRPMFAVIFGLVHGAGFAGYLRSLFMDDIAVNKVLAFEQSLD